MTTARLLLDLIPLNLKKKRQSVGRPWTDVSVGGAMLAIKRRSDFLNNVQSMVYRSLPI